MPIPTNCRCEVRNRGCIDEHGVTDDCPEHGLDAEERAVYYEAIQAGASHDDAMEATGAGAWWGHGEVLEAGA